MRISFSSKIVTFFILLALVLQLVSSCSKNPEKEDYIAFIAVVNANHSQYIQKLNTTKKLELKDQILISLIVLQKLPSFLYYLDDPEVKKFAQARLDYDNLKSSTAISAYKDILYLKPTKYNFLKKLAELELLNILVTESKNQNLDSFLNIEKELKSSKNKIDQYLVINKLLIYSKYLGQVMRVEHALSTLDLAVNQMYKWNLTTDFPRLHVNILHAKTVLFMSEKSYKDYSIPLFEKSIQLADSINYYSKASRMRMNYANILLDLKDTTKSEKLIDEAYFFVDSIDLNNKNYYLISLGNHYERTGKLDSALQYYRRALLSFNSKECSLLKSKLNIYSSLIFFTPELFNLDSIQYYYDKAIISKKCSESEQNMIRYYSYWVSIGLLKHQYLSNKQISNLHKALDLIYEKHFNAELIFHGENLLHLEDFYIFNLTDYLQLMRDNPNHISEKQINMFFQLLLRTKAKSRKQEILRTQRNSSISSRERVEIQSLQRELLDHINTPDKFHESYEELFFLQYNAWLIEEKFENKDVQVNTNFHLEELRENLDQNKAVVLEFIKGHDAYWYYYLDSKQLKVGSIDLLHLESTVKTELRKLKNQQSPDFSELAKLIIPDVIQQSKDSIYIICDGLLETIPFDLLFNSDRSILFPFSIESLYDIKPEYLEPSISILSYTDSKTFKDLNTLKKYAELPFGFEESQNICSLFTHCDLSAGKNFTKKSISESMQKDIVHISTHGFSDINKRLESFIVIRDNTGKAMEYYSHEISSLDSFPKFLNLSGCKSGIGYHSLGMGSSSISNAFIEGGTQTLMKSLWDIDDEATSDFMQLFYSNWLNGISIAQALNQTKSSFQDHNKYSNPYYWSGFILEGNPKLYLKN